METSSITNTQAASREELLFMNHALDIVARVLNVFYSAKTSIFIHFLHHHEACSFSVFFLNCCFVRHSIKENHKKTALKAKVRESYRSVYRSTKKEMKNHRETNINFMKSWNLHQKNYIYFSFDSFESSISWKPLLK